MTLWRPDTCDCIIEFNQNVQWIKTVKICRLHKTLRGQNLLDTVLAQNKRFNSAFGVGVIFTKPQEDLIINSKVVNKLRIRVENLDNFDEHLAFEKSLTFFQNLKRILRGLIP